MKDLKQKVNDQLKQKAKEAIGFVRSNYKAPVKEKKNESR